VDSRDKRYIRHLAMPEIGEAGQRKLASGAVLIVGGGGLGGYHAELLTRAGVGRIRLADRDRVDWSNLPRQILYNEHDAETHAVKAERAAARLRAINSAVEVETHAVDVSSANAAVDQRRLREARHTVGLRRHRRRRRNAHAGAARRRPVSAMSDARAAGPG